MPLRPLRASDVQAISAWLPRVADDLGCTRWSNETTLRQSAGARDVLLYAEDRGVAFVSCQSHAPLPGAARIDLLAVAPGHRRLGTGSRAALALERRLRPSTERIFVLVPASLGLACYFWLRLGYRPLTKRDWPAAPEQRPSIWMARELTRG